MSPRPCAGERGGGGTRSACQIAKAGFLRFVPVIYSIWRRCFSGSLGVTELKNPKQQFNLSSHQDLQFRFAIMESGEIAPVRACQSAFLSLLVSHLLLALPASKLKYWLRQNPYSPDGVHQGSFTSARRRPSRIAFRYQIWPRRPRPIY